MRWRHTERIGHGDDRKLRGYQHRVERKYEGCPQRLKCVGLASCLLSQDATFIRAEMSQCVYRRDHCYKPGKLESQLKLSNYGHFVSYTALVVSRRCRDTITKLENILRWFMDHSRMVDVANGLPMAVPQSILVSSLGSGNLHEKL